MTYNFSQSTSDQLQKWVDSDDRYLDLRRAIHIVLLAVSQSGLLHESMIMKGGVLLGIHYNSPRYTNDIDFSTSISPDKFNQEQFLRELNDSLLRAQSEVDYGLAVRIQNVTRQPPNPTSSFPTLRIKIGYAYQSEGRQMQRLLAGQASRTLTIDFSLNEPLSQPQVISLDGDHTVLVYPPEEILAEKYRAIIQQKTRNRVRRQDAFDIYYLLQNFPSLRSEQFRSAVLRELKQKCSAREITPDFNSLDDPEIKQRSQSEYDKLRDEVTGGIPEFEEIYSEIVSYYKSLPWE